MSVDIVNFNLSALRSGEFLNLSTVRSDKLLGDFDPVSVTHLNFPANSSGRSPENWYSPSLQSIEFNSSFSNAFTERTSEAILRSSPVVRRTSGDFPNTRINTQNQLLMNSLMEFYKVPSNMEKMIKTVNGDSNISLRIVHWFVTNYAKKYYTVYDLDHADSSRFKVYNDYKLKLKAYSNRRFDPFCRWERTMLPLENNKYIETTIGQLNFFKWAIENNVIDYIDANYKEIEADMNLRNTTPKRKQMNSRTSVSSIDSNSSTSSSSTTSSLEQIDSYHDSFTADEKTNSNAKTRKKRVELSVSACKCVKKENVNIVVKF
jgi:hypothetical protein